MKTIKTLAIASAILVGILEFTPQLSAENLIVKSGTELDLPSKAAKIAKDGDVVMLDGEFPNDACIWTQNNLTILGLGNRAVLNSNGKTVQGKAVWVISGNNVIVENIEISGAKVPDKNGAAIRAEGTNLEIRNCYFHHNENGILAGANDQSSIKIFNSEFFANGYGDGYSHNIYIGHIKEFVLNASYSHGAYIGHNVKSRASKNIITYNLISDDIDGQSSMLIDLPNGGLSYIIGNVLIKGSKAENRNAITYGTEGLTNSNKKVYIVHNTMLNSRNTVTFLYSKEKADTAIFANNICTGSNIQSTALVSGEIMEQNNFTSNSIEKLEFVNFANNDFSLKSNSPAIDDAVDLQDSLLIPKFEYVHPLQTKERFQEIVFNQQSQKTELKLDVGAYEFQKLSYCFDYDKSNSSIEMKANTNSLIFDNLPESCLSYTLFISDLSGKVVMNSKSNKNTNNQLEIENLNFYLKENSIYFITLVSNSSNFKYTNKFLFSK